MRALVSSVIFFFTLSSATAFSATRTEALIVLSELMDKGAAANHPEGFRILIDTYFSGVKSLDEHQPEVAAGYFALVEKYAKVLAPYLLGPQSPPQRGPQSASPSTPQPVPGLDALRSFQIQQAQPPEPAQPHPIAQPVAQPESQAAQIASRSEKPAMVTSVTPAGAPGSPLFTAPEQPTVITQKEQTVTAPAQPAAPAQEPAILPAQEPVIAGVQPPVLTPAQPPASAPVSAPIQEPVIAPVQEFSIASAQEPAIAPEQETAIARLEPAAPLLAHPAPSPVPEQRDLPQSGNDVSEEVQDQVESDQSDQSEGEEVGAAASTEEDEADEWQESRENPAATGRVIGGETFYRVQTNDTLTKVAKRYRVSIRRLAQMNQLNPKAILRTGQILRIVDRRIIPGRTSNGLVINIAECTLYYFQNGKLTRSVPIAAGKPESKKSKSWQTPLGSFRVVEKVRNPRWRVPVSIQKEMEELGQEVKTVVPPGPTNPLGKYALRTSLPGILIHGTNRPSSISSYSSHGCIRVSPNDIEALFKEVPLHAAGEIVYRPVKVAVNADGKTFLEVHSDIYGRVDLEEQARELLQETGKASQVDWRKVKRVLAERIGVAEDITRTR